MTKAWDDVRDRACGLYAGGKTLGEVQGIIGNEQGFEASTRAWRTKLKEWNVKRLYDIRDANMSDYPHPRNDSGQWTGHDETESVRRHTDDEQPSIRQSPDMPMVDTTDSNRHPVRDAILRLYSDLRGSLPTQGSENTIKSYMQSDITPCPGLQGIMGSIAAINLSCYIRLLKIFATSNVLEHYAKSELQQLTWLNEDDPNLFVKDCPAEQCNTIEAWCLNHTEETSFATGIFTVAGDFNIKTLCYEILDPCPSRATGSMTSITRSASLARLLLRWKNSGRLPEAGDMVSHLLRSASLSDPTPLFEVLCRQFPSLAKDPRALAAVAGVGDPLRYELSAILFQDDDELSEWLLLASINLEALSEGTNNFLESWNSDHRRCFDRSFAHFVVPFLGYRRPLQMAQKHIAFVVIQCVVHVVTTHFLGQTSDLLDAAELRRRELQEVMRMRGKFGLADVKIPSNDSRMLVDGDESIAVETAETWLVDW